jgi:hypothetical protein
MTFRKGFFESATAQERVGLVDHHESLDGAAERGQRHANQTPRYVEIRE